jgi:murein DD-endopeptidase MepM/ murein hydrolase activator NlpD
MRHNSRRKRAGVLLATFVVAVPASGLAVAEPAGSGRSSPPADASATGPSGVGRIVAAVAEGRPLRPPTAFPVRAAAVGYGEGGAQFGADRGGRVHEGQDLFAPSGTPLLAVRDGVVVETGNDGGRGNYVAIFSARVDETYVYLHMLEPSAARTGQRVRAGERVGRLGCTGSCFGDHLHFEVRRGRGAEGAPRNPLPLLRGLSRRSRSP